MIVLRLKAVAGFGIDKAKDEKQNADPDENNVHHRS
jgi:hypothetical protein